MRAKITKRGLVVPKEMFPDVDEVEIRKRTVESSSCRFLKRTLFLDWASIRWNAV